MAGNASWGVEIGSGALKAVKVVRDGESVRIEDFVVIPHKRRLSAPEIDPKEAARVALGTLISQHDLGKATVAISVPGAQSFARFAKLPPVDKKNLVDIVKFEAMQQIPFPIDEVQWDYQTFVAPDSPDVEVGIFAIRTESVNEVLHGWTDVGVTPDILTLSPLAAYNAIAYDQNFSDTTAGTVILDIGTTSSDLIVAEAGRLWIRTFPIGGHNFTEALVTAFNTSYMKAERLKAEAESSPHARHILQAMRPVFADLAADVQRSISYYTSTHRDAKLTRLVGLGATFELPGLKKFLSQQLGMEVSKLEKFQRVTKVAGDRESTFQSNASQLATAFGLALQGVGNEIIDANLMPMTVVKEAMWREKTKWFTAAAVLALLAGGAMFIRPLLANPGVDPAVKKSIDDTRAELTRLKGAWQGVEAEYKPDTRAVGLLQSFEGRAVIPMIVDDMGKMLKSALDKSGGADIEFKQFDTAYIAPGGSAGGAPTDPNAAPGTTAAAPGARGVVRATLRFTINRDVTTGDQLVQNELQGWLKKNEKLHKEYDISNVSWTFQSTGTEGGEQANPNGGGAGGVGPGAGNPGGPGRNPVGPGSGRRGPAGAGGDRPQGFPPPPPLNGNRPPFGGGGGQNGGAGGSEDVEKLAPLPAIGAPAPGGSVTEYVITWDSVLKEAGK
ncbi:MAG: type IV pilus assembly protein PilM [Phycisphaerales bacterium]